MEKLEWCLKCVVRALNRVAVGRNCLDVWRPLVDPSSNVATVEREGGWHLRDGAQLVPVGTPAAEWPRQVPVFTRVKR
jgi:hypothetical protein